VDPGSRRLTVPPSSLPATRTGRRAGAPTARLLLAALLAGLPGALRAQVPPDTLRPDTLRVDTLGPAPRLPGDTLPPADTVEADTIFYNLPPMDHRPAGGWESGAWRWNHDEIVASGASTLVDLVESVPGMVALRAGDYGTPQAATAFGLGGGRIRVFRDGFEVVPLAGGSADLSRVGLGGITEVRLERFPGEVRIYLSSLEFDDGRPYSLLEAGTGDLNTNLLRGTFANPTTLGGDLSLALERADSRGARGNAAGNVQGTWLRYQLHHGNTAGLALDFRRMGSASDDTAYAAKVTRTDLTIRGRASLPHGLTAEAYWGRSQHDVEDTRDTFATEGGRRSQVGVRAAWEHEGLFGEAAYRHFGGAALPSGRLDLSVGGDRATVGGFVAELDRAAWEGTSTSARRLRAWTRPLLGLSAFASWDSGTYGARTLPLLGVTGPPDTTTQQPPTPEEPPPDFRVTDRTASRLGLQWAWRGVVLSGARLRIRADSLLPVGIQPDRGQPALAGGERRGWEVWARFPLPVLEGLHVEGSLQEWDEAWSYMPRRIYRGAAVYHRTFLETGDFEMWATVGVTGHDPMTVRQVVGELTDDQGNVLGPELGQVPFYQSWYGRLQLRIVTVRVFVGWDNFTIRRNLQDFPDRLLPITRAFYGVRWTMWS
jgi:hypothetical protein